MTGRVSSAWQLLRSFEGQRRMDSSAGASPAPRKGKTPHALARGQATPCASNQHKPASFGCWGGVDQTVSEGILGDHSPFCPGFSSQIVTVR